MRVKNVDGAGVLLNYKLDRQLFRRYLKVTIICRYIFLQIVCFACTKVCDFGRGSVRGRRFLMLRIILPITNACKYKFCDFGLNRRNIKR